jgi:predicted unusual protein kinase regulating ubiquinone biosynthesis (AarF/ABC1/UbiB family)
MPGNKKRNKKKMSKETEYSDQARLATSKMERSMKILQTGVRVGSNYVKHYAGKAVGLSDTKEKLDDANAKAIFKSLNELKGSALKVAQMLSMDKGILPEAYRQVFEGAQRNAQPLSLPLIINTFKKKYGKLPSEIFDEFEPRAAHAASIGQVHRARIGNQLFAVKIQYPGVAESIRSDLRLVKPFALRLLDMQEMELEHYFEEVESKLVEETDYQQELKNGVEIGSACAAIDGLVFPKYYPELSNDRILVMDWIEGMPLQTYFSNHTSIAEKNRIGQILWDFYSHQMHQLKKVHADPHPGNFLITPEGNLAVLDFGCVKEISDDFYTPFFELIRHTGKPDAIFEKHMETLGLIIPGDTAALRQQFIDLYYELIGLFARPYRESPFDFGDQNFMNALYQRAETLAKMPELKEARGSRDFIYINRTHFGLYSILSDIQAKVQTL